MTVRFVTLVCLLAIPTGLSAQDSDHHGAWIPDYDKAVAQAKAEKKDLLVEFTGSDWCQPCMRLYREVFGHEEFQTAASKKYVLCALDFPRGEDAQKRVPNKERNEAVRKLFQVQGYPTVLLVSPEGDIFARTGFRPGGVELYLEHLDAVAVEGRAALEEARSAHAGLLAAKPEERKALFAAILAKLEELSATDPGASVYLKATREMLTVDGDNALGLKEMAVVALLEQDLADDRTFQAAKEVDPKNAKAIFEKAVMAQASAVDSGDEPAAKAALAAIDALVSAGPIQDQDLAVDLYVNAATWSFHLFGEKDRARAYADRLAAMDLGQPGIDRLIQEIREG